MYKNLSPGAVGLSGMSTEILPLARAVGFGGVDPAWNEPADVLKRLFAENGLQFGSVGLPVDFRADQQRYEQGMAGLEKAARAAAELGCRRCATWLRPFSDDLPYAENFRLHRDRLRPAAEILRAHGLRFGLEFVAPKTLRDGHRYEFIHTLGQVLDLCDAIGTGNMGVLLDSWHWYTAHGTVEEIRSRLSNDLIVLVHVNDAPVGVAVDRQVDSVRELPGATGIIDIAGFLKALTALGYDGPVTPEPFCKALREMPREAAAQKVGQAMDRIWTMAGLT